MRTATDRERFPGAYWDEEHPLAEETTPSISGVRSLPEGIVSIVRQVYALRESYLVETPAGELIPETPEEAAQAAQYEASEAICAEQRAAISRQVQFFSRGE